MKKLTGLLAVTFAAMALTGCESKHTTHTYGTPTFDWSDYSLDRSSGNVYCVFSCTGCEETLTKQATVTYDTKEKTCTEDGYKRYTATYESEELGGPYTDNKEITYPSLGGHNMIKIDGIEATCQRSGNIEYYHCQTCNQNFTDAEGKNPVDEVSIPRRSHDMVEHDEVAATCEHDGNIHYYHCNMCGQDFSDAEGYYPIEDVAVAGGHQLVEYPYKDSTCTKEGNIHYFECSVCHKKYDSATAENELSEVVIAKKAHEMTHHPLSVATCLEPGSIEHYSCSTCGQLFADAEGNEVLTGDIYSYKNHSWSLSGSCRYCNTENFEISAVAERTTGSTEEVFDQDIPEGFTNCYLSTGDVGGGLNKNRYFKSTPLAAYKSVRFAIKTLANPDNSERLFLKVWKGDLEVLATDGWVNVECTKLSEGEWEYTLSNGKTAIYSEVSTLYDLLSFHHPSGSDTPIPSSFYITEVVGLKSESHVHQFTDFVEESESTCFESGVIGHYHCECGAYFDSNYDVITSPYKPTTHKYDDAGTCSKCGSINLMSNANVRYNDYMECDTDGIAPGYSKVYLYSHVAGGGEATTANGGNSFFNWGAKFNSVTYIRFAILADSSTNIRMYVRENDGAKAQRKIPAIEKETWVEIVAEKKSDSTWTITNSLGKFDNSLDSLTVNPTDGRLNEVIMFLADVPFKITDIIGMGAKPHVHDSSTLIPAKEATCAEPGYIAHYVCDTCGCYLNENKEVISSISVPTVKHNYVDGVCSICKSKIYSYQDHCQDPSQIELSTDYEAPAGFNYVYHYKSSTGGGTSEGFLKHEGNVGLGSWESPRVQFFSFAVLVTAKNGIGIRNFSDSQIYALTPLDDNQFVTVSFTLDSANNKYVCTNNSNSTIVTCNGSNSIYGIFQLISATDFYVTELLFRF